MRIIIAILLFITGAAAQAEKSPEPAGKPLKEAFKEGEHYVRLENPVRTADPDKIEVAEVFWYGCGHCYAFEPQLKQWRKTLPESVLFVESPAMWNRDMETHARIFYTAKALGVLDTMHPIVFDAMHIKKLGLKRAEQIQTLFEQNGVAADDFEKTFNAFSVTSAVKQANARARSYGITGTPEIVVDGTYRISGRLAGSQTNMLAVANYLVCKIDAEKNSAAQSADMSSFCSKYQ